MEKLTFDGVEIEVSEAAAKVFMAAQKKHADALTAMQTKLDAADNKCPKCGKGLKCPECSGEKKQDAADLETLKAELVKQTARADAAEKVIADAAAEKAKAEAAAAEKVRIDALVAEQVKAELAKKASEKPIVRVDSTEPVDHRAQFAAAVANACEASLAKK